MTQLKVYKIAFYTIAILFLLSLTYMFSHVDVNAVQKINKDQTVSEDGKLELDEKLLQKIELDQYEDYRVLYSYNKLFSKSSKIDSISPYGKTS
ncbi:hypothetical protein [Kurthia zopfii]|uniref:hypothetical protein n=1 Tax=Kurthia zopfii TaxID=1650 RepID=UPI000F6EAC98|nr:hypothetical protein [Kurthia zopfii]VEI05935.1 Uncharacterised protein [Kurthia zopfii]